MATLVKSRPSCVQIPPVRSISILTDEELRAINQDTLSDLMEQLNKEIIIAEKEYQEEKKKLDSIKDKFPWLESLREMEYEAEGTRGEVTSLRQYREKVKTIWRKKEGLR